ncbi:MAG: C39 family peptidase [Anaerolineae bacterium]|nr:C39 family peptidase [Anaerolineae bacterium]
MTILEIPYVSQKDPRTAGYSINDCGPACVVMMAKALGKNVTTDQVYRDTGITEKGGLWVWQVQRAGAIYGLNLKRHDKTSDAGLTNLKYWVDEGRPALVLVNYAPIMRAGLHESNIQGGHYVVVVGYDDSYIYVHDPYWNGTGGAYRKWPIQVFNEAWYQHGTMYNRIALVPAQAIARGKEPDYEIPADIKKRLRTKAIYEGVPAPIVKNDDDYQTMLNWLGDWGTVSTKYTIQAGDTLGEIADEFYGNSGLYTVIAVWNDITNVGRIYVGQKLEIPLPHPTDGEEETEKPVYRFTHQQLINAFARSFQKVGEGDKYWDYIEGAGLAYIVQDRSARYTGPDINTLPGIPDNVKKMVLEELGVE